MLILFSDTHLSDGSTAVNVHGSAFDLLGEAIADAAAPQAKAARRIEVVLLGDVFDLVRSSYWHTQAVAPDDRPWGGRLDPVTGLNERLDAVEAQFLAVFERVLATGSSRSLLRMLNTLPVLEGQRPQVTYVVGNHDRVLHNFASLRQRLQRELPNVDLRFATEFVSDRYGVVARHGHEWDPHNHGWQFRRQVLQPGLALGRFDPGAYQTLTIGEVLTAELLSGLLWRLAQSLDPRCAQDRAFLRGVQDLHHLRPFTAVFDWIAWFVRDRPAAFGAYLERLRVALQETLARLLECSLARRWDALRTDLLLAGDLTDQLSHARAFVNQKRALHLLAQYEPLARLTRSLAGWNEASRDLDACAAGARAEFQAALAAGRSVRFVIYGHTHEARQECLRARPDEPACLYVNTGTFLPFVDCARDRQGFWTAHRLTYAFVYADDEDDRNRLGPGPTLDVVSGIRCKRYRD